MVEAMHAARLATLQDTLFGLLVEQMSGEGSVLLDGIQINFKYMGGEQSIDITYLRGDMPMGGEGL